jgi:hypothetical protein
MLLAGHPDADGRPRVRLDRDSMQRIVNWLDLNAQFYGDYSHNRDETRGISPEGEKALRAFVAERFGDELARQPYAALVNHTLPTESRILKAALPAAVGGWGQIAKGAYAGTSDPAYRKMLSLIRACIVPHEHVDIAGTCGRDPGGGDCPCGNCWVRKARADRLGKKFAPTSVGKAIAAQGE